MKSVGKPTTLSAVESAVFRKVTSRIVPILFLAFIAAYMNRTNVGFVQRQMSSDLELSGVAYGVGAGIFFIGYFLFEVPSNLMMHRIGVRKTMLRIMLLWGATSSAMMFITSDWMFYILRFLLGVFEAGFVPAILLYLTYWYPQARRGAIVASIFVASPVAGIIGGPLAGSLLSNMNGVLGLSGWQWVFLFEGIPALILAVIVYKVLADKPSDAKWLTEGEKDLVRNALESDSEKKTQAHHTFRTALADGRLYAMCFIYFCLSAGVYIVLFWLPTLFSTRGNLEPWQMGLYIMIPYAAAAVFMPLLARRSDRTGERRWHITFAGALAMVSLVLATQTTNFAATVILMSIATAGIFATTPLMLTLPAKIFSGSAAAGGIALVNSVGNLSGFVTPIGAGFINDLTGRLDGSLWAIAGLLMIGCMVLHISMRKADNKALAMQAADQAELEAGSLR